MLGKETHVRTTELFAADPDVLRHHCHMFTERIAE
jgi:hypothetical protein